MQRWEYLFVTIRPGSGQHQVTVKASIDRYAGTRDKTSVAEEVSKYGLEGWEMVNCQAWSGDGLPNFFPQGHLTAVFKRPVPEA
jgi:hypothetical protein